MSSLLAIDARGATDGEWPGRSVIPGLPRHWIRRDRLNGLLSAGVQHRLTIVTGPPGAGKSVLLADWSREYADGHTVWLALGPGDNDPDVFGRRVRAALDGGHPGHDSGSHAFRLRHRSRSVLILDDFHYITHPEIIDGVAGLTRELPPHVRLVVAGQQVKGPQLQRSILRGEVTVLDDADLRFTVHEAAALIALISGKYLPIDSLKTLTDRCEGWAAGLYLAGSALADEPDPSSYVERFSGTSAPVAEYLEQEGLVGSPLCLVSFFLRTSVLEHLTSDLCCAVTGRNDAGVVLEWLASRHRFVVPVDGAANTYRYHRLFADLLRSRLEREGGSLASEAHYKAGTWLERSGDTRAAARHFALGGAYERAFRLTFPSNPLVSVDHDPKRGTTVMADVVANDLEHDPARMYVVAAALLAAERPDEALVLLGRLESLTADGLDAAAWKGRVEFLWAVHADRLADASGSLDHCRAAKELMQSVPAALPDSTRQGRHSPSWLDAIDTTISDSLPLLAARAHSWLGEPDNATATLVNHFGSPDRAAAAEPSIFAVVACRNGRLGDAVRFANEALRQGLERRDADDPGALEARLVIAEVLFERNDLAGAEEHLDIARAMCGSMCATRWMWSVELDFVRLMIAQQRPKEALSRLWQLRRADRGHPASGDLLRRLNHVEVGCRVLLGDLEGVLLLARSTPSGDFNPETLARVDLFTGRPDRVLARLRLRPSSSFATEIRRLLLVACADVQRGDILRAEDRVRRAVDRARPEGYVRPFLEEARLTVPTLQSISGTSGDPYLAYLVFQGEQLVPRATPPTTSALIEPLTERERELLTYLGTHLHLREIAAAMHVSHNTVKTHVKAIYRKVGAGSRSEAVTMARARGLL